MPSGCQHIQSCRTHEASLKITDLTKRIFLLLKHPHFNVCALPSVISAAFDLVRIPLSYKSQPNRPAAPAGESMWDNWASTAGADQVCTALKSLNSSVNKNSSVRTSRNQNGLGIYLNQEVISKMHWCPIVCNCSWGCTESAISSHHSQPSEMLHKCHMSSWNFEYHSFHSFNLKIFLIFLLCYRHWARVLYNLWIHLSNNHLIN